MQDGEDVDVLRNPDPSNDLIGDGQTADMTTSKNTIESKEFELLSKEGVLTVVKYDCCPDAFQGRSPDKLFLSGQGATKLQIQEIKKEINFKMVLKRRAYYPVMTLVIPCVITAVLLCLTFLMPPDAGEKVGLSKLY